MDDSARDAILDGIARGLRKLDDDGGRIGVDGKPPRAYKLWEVDVVLLDAEGDVVRVASLVAALDWIVSRQHCDENGADISGAVSAHVQPHEGKCVEPGCGKFHVEPDPSWCAENDCGAHECHRCFPDPGCTAHPKCEEFAESQADAEA